MVEKVILHSHQTAITIISDSRELLTSLNQLNSYTSTSHLKNLIYQRTSALENKGLSVTIRWISSHVGSVGHNKADQSSREKAQKEGKPVEQWSLLTYVKKKIIE